MQSWGQINNLLVWLSYFWACLFVVNLGEAGIVGRQRGWGGRETGRQGGGKGRARQADNHNAN